MSVLVFCFYLHDLLPLTGAQRRESSSKQTPQAQVVVRAVVENRTLKADFFEQ